MKNNGANNGKSTRNKREREREREAKLKNSLNSAKNLGENTSNSSQNSKSTKSNSTQNSSQNSQQNPKNSQNLVLKQIFALPKWARIVLAVLSVVALLGLGFGTALQIWAKDKEFSTNLSFYELEIWKSERLGKLYQAKLDELKNEQNASTPSFEGDALAKGLDLKREFSYKGRLRFERLDFLLRSRVIAYIDIVRIKWHEKVDEKAISSIESGNRNISFISTQPPEFFDALKGENLGVLTYKIDFTPFFETILKYYFWIFLAIFLIFGIKNTLLSWRVLGENESLNLSKFDKFFLIFTALLCAGICAFTFWLGFPGYNYITDLAAVIDGQKANWQPAFISSVLEILYFVFGRHTYYMFLFCLVPLYTGLFFIVATFYIRTRSIFSLIFLFPTFLGEFYLANFVPFNNNSLSAMLLCLYSMILFLVLVPLNSSKIQRICAKILWLGVFVLMFFAILWRHNAIFSVFPAFFIIIYLWQRRNFSLKKYALFVFLSAILCLGIVKIVPKILTKGEAYPAAHTFLHQIAATCVPANDSSCFKDEWYLPNKSFADVKSSYENHILIADAMINDDAQKPFTSRKMQDLEKQWLKSIAKYPLNFLKHEFRMFYAIWTTNSFGWMYDTKDIQDPNATGSPSPYNFEVMAKFPENERKITFTPLKERIYSFIFENKITLNCFISVLVGFVLLVISAFILWQNAKHKSGICAKFLAKFGLKNLSQNQKTILIFVFAASFAAFGSAFFIAAFSPIPDARYMRPVASLSLAALFGFVAFLCELRAKKFSGI